MSTGESMNGRNAIAEAVFHVSPTQITAGVSGGVDQRACLVVSSLDHTCRSSLIPPATVSILEIRRKLQTSCRYRWNLALGAKL